MPSRVLRNSIANVLGSFAPSILQIVTLPFIVRTLGEAQYGVYTMVMAIVGYFVFLDPNFGAGIVKYLAEFESVGKKREVGEVVSLGLLAYFGIGALGALLIFFLAESVVTGLFSVPPELEASAVIATRVAAAGFFFSQLQVLLKNIPQALGHYPITAGVEVLEGILMPSLSVLVLWLGYGLLGIVVVRVLLNVMNVALLAVAVRRLLPELKFVRPSAQMAKRVGSFSGFAYFATLAAVVYYQADKLIISALAGVVALAYYVVPFNLASRVMGLSFRMASVIYPEASRLGALNQLGTLREIYYSAARYIFFINSYFLIAVVLFGYEILYYWMGPQFAEQGALVMVFIVTACLVDSMTNIPALVNDGLGHPKVTGMFSLGRACLGLALIAVGTKLYGIQGAAVAHLATFLVYSFSFLVFVHGRTVPFSFREMMKGAFGPVILPVAALCAAFWAVKPEGLLSLGASLTLGSAILFLWTAYGVAFILRPAHRAALVTQFLAKVRGQRQTSP